MRADGPLSDTHRLVSKTSPPREAGDVGMVAMLSTRMRDRNAVCSRGTVAPMAALLRVSAGVLLLVTLASCGGDAPGPTDDAGALCTTSEDCDDGLFCTGTIVCSPASPSADARGCVAPVGGACLAGQLCSEATQTCTTDCAVTRDADGDGHQAVLCGGDDCDDSDALRFPGNAEACDTSDHDEDCDPLTFGYRDQDMDDTPDARCCNVDGDSMNCGTDCNDNNPTVNPNTSEVCDAFDNDCDGETDEDLISELYPDEDQDGAGDASASPVMGCVTGGNLVSNDNDCDDANPASNPGAPEICDTLDNDCDTRTDEGTVDVPWYVDADGDTHGDPSLPTVLSCVIVPGRSTRATDCDDDAATTFPAAPELCDRVDNNCSSGGGVEPLEDVDMDGHAALAAACSLGDLPRDDCDDTNASLFAGAPELCDRLDNDCSSGGGLVASEDSDQDGHAPIGATCSGGFPTDDCDDADMIMYPGATEVCNRRDDDCSLGGGTDVAEDGDMDGHAPIGGSCSGGLPEDDCNDALGTTYPGAPERCDRVDSDCSLGGAAQVSEDQDQDGFAPSNAACSMGFPKTDCDDALMSTHPGASEVCNAINDDCDTTTDELCANGLAAGTGQSSIQFSTYNATGGDVSGMCPAGQYAVGVRVHLVRLDGQLAPGYLNGIAAICATPQVVSAGGAPFSYVVTTGTTTDATIVGKTTGNSGWTTSQTALVCPANTFVTRIYGGGLRVECTSLTITGSQGAYGLGRGAITALSAGTLAGAPSAAACPVGWLVAGITGRRTSSTTPPGIVRGNAECRQVTVTTVAP